MESHTDKTDKPEEADNLEEAVSILRKAEAILRNGSVIYSNRHIGYLPAVLGDDDEKIQAYFRIKSRLRRGEQLDAQAEMLSLMDKISNEIKARNSSENVTETHESSSPDIETAQ